jgi:RIO kinase 1
MIVAGQFDDASSDDDDCGESGGERFLSRAVERAPPVAHPSAQCRRHQATKPTTHWDDSLADDCTIRDDMNDSMKEEEEEDDCDDYSFFNSSSQRSTTTCISHRVANRLQQMQDLECTPRTLHTDRNDRSTLEQVLDPRTRYILFQMLQSNVLSKLEGCLSTGKEANVYYALAGPNAYAGSNDHTASTDASAPPKIITEYALKVYKTSILVFRDRDQYVAGEYRYRNGYCRSNPRKMIALWAEKELRNYRRLHQAGIPCPRPLGLQRHVLVLEFLGTDGWPAPRLKDVPWSGHSRTVELYRQSVLLLRHMYQRCHLVHGDFSEYNLLYHCDRLYVIDVSQSVETQHPAAYDFLRLDIRNISDYFAKQLLGEAPLLTTRQCFDFIVTKDLGGGHDEATERLYWDRLWLQQRTAPVPEDPLFLQTYLPRTLEEIALPSDRRTTTNDSTRVPENELSYEAQAVAQMTVPRAPVSDGGGKDSDDGLASSDDDETEENDPSRPSRAPRSPEALQLERQLRKEERRRNKKVVKEQQSIKRQEKKKKKKKNQSL